MFRTSPELRFLKAKEPSFGLPLLTREKAFASSISPTVKQKLWEVETSRDAVVLVSRPRAHRPFTATAVVCGQATLKESDVTTRRIIVVAFPRGARPVNAASGRQPSPTITTAA